jgi:hypothetical protein
MPTDAPHWQDAFAAMLRDPAAAAPPGVLATARRLDVHRVTVHATLVDCLAARFPVVRRLLGEECFVQTALDFVRAHPPSSPALVFYGGGFAAFLEDCAPLAGYPWLGDVARLEWARHEAFNGADAEPCDAAMLATLDPDRLMLTRLSLHPTVRLVASRHPVWAIWRTNTEDAEVQAVTAAAESALVVRPDWTVTVEPLPPGGFAFLEALMADATLGEAAAAAHEAGSADADVTSTLALIIRTRAIAAVRAP